MPTCEYRCRRCDKTFSVAIHIVEHDRGGITCPECRSDQVEQQYSAFFAKTGKKS